MEDIHCGSTKEKIATMSAGNKGLMSMSYAPFFFSQTQH
jgi:hypothetical protein